MAADPIPMNQSASEVKIDADGTVTGLVKVNNRDMVKFEVTSYPPGTDTCVVTITDENITWEASKLRGQNSIKVGN